MLIYFRAIWNILLLFGIFYDHSVHFVFIWYFFPVLVSCTEKNLATLNWTIKLMSFRDSWLNNTRTTNWIFIVYLSHTLISAWVRQLDLSISEAASKHKFRETAIEILEIEDACWRKRANFFQLVSNLFSVVRRGFGESCKNGPL
jgi:hypothetical protein